MNTYKYKNIFRSMLHHVWLKTPVMLVALILLAAGSCGDSEEEKEEPGAPPVFTASSVSFTDIDLDEGQIAGIVNFEPSSNVDDVTEYRLYWGQDGNTKLAGNDTIISTVLSGVAIEFPAFPIDTQIPSGATHFLVYTANSNGEMATCVSVNINDMAAPANTAVSVSFTDLDTVGGLIEGAPTIVPAADESDVTEYRLYWGQDGSTKLATDDAVIDTVQVGGGTSFAAFAANTALPVGATHLLVFTANADGEMASGVSVLIHDIIVPLNAAAEIVFYDNDMSGNQIAGAPTFTSAADESDITEYRLYWGQDATTKLASNDSVIDTLPVDGAEVFASFAANTVPPFGATHLLLFTANADGEMTTGVSVLIDDIYVPSDTYVLNTGLYGEIGTVSVINVNNIVTATITVGVNPWNIAFTPDGNFAYVTNHDMNDGQGTVSVIDTSTNTVTDTIYLGTYGAENIVMSPDGAFVYVTTSSGFISKIDTSTNSIITKPATNSLPDCIAISPDGSTLYADLTSSFEIFDTSDFNGFTNLISVNPDVSCFAITPDGGFVYASQPGINSVSLIDLSNGDVLGTVPVGAYPLGVAIPPDASFVYVVNYEDSTVSVIDTSDLTAVPATITVGAYPKKAAVTPDGRYVYVTNHSDDTVSVIDTLDHSILATITVGKYPNGIAIKP